MIPDAAWEVLKEGGISVIAVIVIAYLFYLMMKSSSEDRRESLDRAERNQKELMEAHRIERGDWLKTIRTDRDAANALLQDLNATIQSSIRNSGTDSNSPPTN